MAWEQLQDILAENAEELLLCEQTEPVECPNDGTVLESGTDGTLHCPFDGWTSR